MAPGPPTRDPDTAPSLTRLRPIAIANAIASAWHKWKAEQLATYLSPAFLPTQGGGLKGRTLESLIENCLALIEETTAANRYRDVDSGDRTEEERRMLRERQTELYVTSWDYASTFDRVSPRTVREIWVRLGVPTVIADSIRRMWTQQGRWIEVGPLLSPHTILVERSLPRGHPAAMLGTATMLMGPLRRQAAPHPRTTFRTFADDRTAAPTSGEELQSIEDEWDLLESTTPVRQTITFRATGCNASESISRCNAPCSRPGSARNSTRHLYA